MSSGSSSTASKTRSATSFQVRDTPKTVRDITEAVMRRVVGNRLGSDVLTVGRVAVSSEAKEEIQKILTPMRPGCGW